MGAETVRARGDATGTAWQRGYSWPIHALMHWEVELGGTSMKVVRGADERLVEREKMMMRETMVCIKGDPNGIGESRKNKQTNR